MKSVVLFVADSSFVLVELMTMKADMSVRFEHVVGKQHLLLVDCSAITSAMKYRIVGAKEVDVVGSSFGYILGISSGETFEMSKDGLNVSVPTNRLTTEGIQHLAPFRALFGLLPS